MLEEYQSNIFRTILIDPPWKYRNTATEVAAERRYKTMEIEEIIKVFEEIDRISDDGGSHLWLWITKDHRRHGEMLIEVAGYEFKTEFIWVKGRIEKNEFVFHTGFGNDNRMCHETLMLGIKNNMRTANGRNEPSVFYDIREDHSRKPEKSFALINRNSPDDKLEIFARKKRRGWFSFGDQLDEEEDIEEVTLFD
jgi:N6-adenosine-specific RNA methylase IME4